LIDVSAFDCTETKESTTGQQKAKGNRLERLKLFAGASDRSIPAQSLPQNMEATSIWRWTEWARIAGKQLVKQAEMVGLPHCQSSWPGKTDSEGGAEDLSGS
jgi:hypothetical protein